MSVIDNSLLLTAPAGGSSYQVSRSLRFNSADSAYLSRTPSVAGNRKTWTWAGWIKRSGLNDYFNFYGNAEANTAENGLLLRFLDTNAIDIYETSSSIVWRKTTTPVYRDPGAWFHLVVQYDTTNATAGDRVKLYVNGERVTTFSSSSDPSLNYDGYINNTSAHSIGRPGAYNGGYFSGYLADIHFIGGQALDPSSFTETDATTGQLIPKAYTGSYGTNGFHLPFSDNSTTAALGAVEEVIETSTITNVVIPNSQVTWTVTGTGDAAPAGELAKIVAALTSPSTTNIGITPNTGIASITLTPNVTVAVGAVRLFVGNGAPYWGGNYIGVTTTLDGATQLQPVGGNYLAPYNCPNLVGKTLSPSKPITFSWNFIPSGLPANTFSAYFAGGFLLINGVTAYNNANIAPYTITLLNNTNLSKINVGDSVVEIGGSGDASGTVYEVNVGAPSIVTGANSGTWSVGATIRNTGINWTVNNFSVTAGSGNDSLIDTPTSYGTDTGVGGEVRGNYCVLNPLNTHTSITLSNGNLDYSHSSSGGITVGTIGVSSGKYYWEHVSGTAYALIGLYQSGARDMGFVGTSGVSLGFTSTGFATASGGPTVANNISFTTSDVIGLALDMDAGTLTIYKNGTATSLVFSGLTGTWSPAEGANGTSSGVFNFGQRAFAYTAPSGFKALCDTNLPAPAVAKGSSVMDVALYTGNFGSKNISGLNLSPDLVWIKARGPYSGDHNLFDVVRGTGNRLRSNTTNQEDAYGGLTAFNSDGFTLEAKGAVNGSGESYVAWTWDAGTSTVTNTAGSITSQVRANPSAGFSVMTGSTPASNVNFTFGHNLGIAPSLVIYKHTAVSGNWQVYHRSGGGNNYNLNSTAGPANSGTWSGLDPTSTLITIPSTIISANSSAFVCYAFAPVSGYSSFGSYTGNGSNDGPFVFCNFRPRWVMIKSSSIGGPGYDWCVRDSSRNLYNVTDDVLSPNTSGTGFTAGVDFLSNGFRLRNSGPTENASSQTYVWAAFAESPFQYARAR